MTRSSKRRSPCCCSTVRSFLSRTNSVRCGCRAVASELASLYCTEYSLQGSCRILQADNARAHRWADDGDPYCHLTENARTCNTMRLSGKNCLLHLLTSRRRTSYEHRAEEEAILAESPGRCN